MTECTLCTSKELEPVVVSSNDHRKYYKCKRCSLIFVDRGFHLSREAETARYALHQNSIGQTGYVEFLSRVVDPCLNFLTNEMIGLDYGCGPTPTLSKILAAKNLTCFDYDPIFGFDHQYPAYDYIFATECFEHFYYPGDDLMKIHTLLKHGGILGIMTERWEHVDTFATWHYKRDPTHVSFFHENTFRYICEVFSYHIKYQDANRVIVLQKL